MILRGGGKFDFSFFLPIHQETIRSPEFSRIIARHGVCVSEAVQQRMNTLWSRKLKRTLPYWLVLLSFPLVPQRATAQLEYGSIFGVQKSTLTRGNLYFSITADMVNDLKIYDESMHSYITKPSRMVFNDVGLSSFMGYGLTDRASLFVEIPIRSVRQYSLSPTLVGEGLADVKVGGTLRIFDDEKKSGLDAVLSTTLPVGANTPPGEGEYPLGINALQMTLSLDGYSVVGTYGFQYSAYYNFVGNDGGLNYGDWTGLYLLLNKDSETPLGTFSFVAGLNAAYKIDDQMSGKPVSGSYDYYFNVLASVSYYCSQNLDFTVGIPYTVYQKNTWFTNYSVMLGVDFQIGL
jgi:hypothetical protein